MTLTLCLLQDPWITYVDGNSVLTVEAFVVYDGTTQEREPVLLSAIGNAADEAANYAAVGSLVEIEVGEASAQAQTVEAEYCNAYGLGERKQFFARSLKVLPISVAA